MIGFSFNQWFEKMQKYLAEMFVSCQVSVLILQGRNQDLNLAKQKYETLTGHKNR